jgi:hypothetical protein
MKLYKISETVEHFTENKNLQYPADCSPRAAQQRRSISLIRILFIWSTSFSGVWVSRQTLRLSR